MASGSRSWARPASRYLEFDKLVFAALGAGFILVAAAFWFLLTAGSGAGPVSVGIVSVLLSALTVGATLAGYKWRAAVPAAALVALLALVLLPRAFVIDSLLLRDALGLPPMRLQLVLGLTVGALALGFLVFLIVGFIAPLVAAIIAWRRMLPGAVPTLIIKAILIGAAILVAAAPSTPAFRDVWFGLLRPSREAIVRQVQAQENPAGQFVPPHTFPRLACCGNVIRVFENGDRILFPMSEYGDGFWAYFYDRSTRDDGVFTFRTLQDYGDGWKRVALDKPQDD